MATKANPGAFDCFAAAKPLEPMFVLLGRDRMAPALVRVWAAARRSDGEGAAKVDEALACAGAMDTWLQAMDREALETVALLRMAGYEVPDQDRFPDQPKTMLTSETVHSALEELMSGVVNMNNFVKANPGASAHPIFMLAMSQLRSAIKTLGGDTEIIDSIAGF